MQCNSPTEIARLCYDVAQCYQVSQDKAPNWERVALLIGTGAVETGLQRGVDTKGMGLWNIPLRSAMNAFSQDFDRRFLFRKKVPASWILFSRAWLGISSVPSFISTQREMRYLLVHDDRFSCAMAMWFYFGHLDILKDNLSDIANFWYMYYPTDHKKRKSGDFLDAWSGLKCDELMHSLGYR